MSEEQIIGPNACHWCGGEYGEHRDTCRELKRGKMWPTEVTLAVCPKCDRNAIEPKSGACLRCDYRPPQPIPTIAKIAAEPKVSADVEQMIEETKSRIVWDGKADPEIRVILREFVTAALAPLQAELEQANRYGEFHHHKAIDTENQLQNELIEHAKTKTRLATAEERLETLKHFYGSPEDKPTNDRPI